MEIKELKEFLQDIPDDYVIIWWMPKEHNLASVLDKNNKVVHLGIAVEGKKSKKMSLAELRKEVANGS